MIKPNISNWTEAHLLVFLYQAIALSDYVLKAEEIEIIRSKTNKILYNVYGYGHEEAEKIGNEAKKIADEVSPNDHNQIIEELALKFPLSKSRYNLLIEDLNLIAKSDKYVSIEEHSLMYYIRLQFLKDY